MMPTVSVILPVYNEAHYIADSVESILSQTYTDFEFIIIDDGSSDGTVEILQQYARQDRRVQVYENKRNMGIVTTLNRGLDLATGTFIARMDADDYAYPERLAKQVKYMQQHPTVVLTGTRFHFMDTTGNLADGKITLPTSMGTATLMKWDLLWGTAILHPTAMFRTAVIDTHSLRYRLEYETAEDYFLWCELAEYGDVVRLDECLIRYRVNEHGITQTRRDEQLIVHTNIMYDRMSDFLEVAQLPDRAFKTIFDLAHRPRSSQQFRDFKPDFIGAIRLIHRLKDRFLADYPLTSAEKVDFKRRIIKLHHQMYIAGRDNDYSLALWLGRLAHRWYGLQ